MQLPQRLGRIRSDRPAQTLRSIVLQLDDELPRGYATAIQIARDSTFVAIAT